jgi:hypothetical protein
MSLSLKTLPFSDSAFFDILLFSYEQYFLELVSSISCTSAEFNSISSPAFLDAILSLPSYGYESFFLFFLPIYLYIIFQ